LLQLLAVFIDDNPRSFLQTTSVISWGLVALLVATGTWAAHRE